MNVLIFGRDSSTHAFAWKLVNSSAVHELVLAPGNAGTAFFAPAATLDLHDSAAITTFVLSESIDLVVVDTQASSAGLADEIRALPLPVFGAPRTLEWLHESRCRSREWVQRHLLPAPRSRACETRLSAEKYAATLPLPLIVAADRAAGPVIPCHDRAVVPAAIAECLAGATAVLIEEVVQGPLVTAAFLTDGQTALPVPATRMYRRGNQPYAPFDGAQSGATPLWGKLNSALQQAVRDPLFQAIQADNLGLRGWVSATCIAGPRGPVIQSIALQPPGFEAATVLLRLGSDLLPLINGCAHGTLAAVEPPRWGAPASVAVGIARSSVGAALPAIDALEPGVLVFHHATSPALPNEYVPLWARLTRPPRPAALSVAAPTTFGAEEADPLIALVAASAADRPTAREQVYTSLSRSHIASSAYRPDVAAREL